VAERVGAAGGDDRVAARRAGAFHQAQQLGDCPGVAAASHRSVVPDGSTPRLVSAVRRGAEVGACARRERVVDPSGGTILETHGAGRGPR
jgi:hypothetical protein